MIMQQINCILILYINVILNDNINNKHCKIVNSSHHFVFLKSSIDCQVFYKYSKIRNMSCGMKIMPHPLLMVVAF